MGSGWCARDIPDLTGRRAVVTGATAGWAWNRAGAEPARGGRGAGSARPSTGLGRGRGDRPGHESRTPPAVRGLDLADLSSVPLLRRRVDGPLDLLVNNAGVMAIPPARPPTGSRCSSARTTSVTSRSPDCCSRPCSEPPCRGSSPSSSGAHRIGRIDFDDLQHDGATGDGRPTGSRSSPTSCSRSSSSAGPTRPASTCCRSPHIPDTPRRTSRRQGHGWRAAGSGKR